MIEVKSVSVGRIRRPTPSLILASCLAALAIPAAPAFAQAAPPKLEAALKSASGADRETRAFYAARGHRPIWIRGGAIGPEADRLLELIETSDAERLDPDKYRPRRLRDAIEDARRSGSAKALARAEMQLTRSFADYVRDVRQPRSTSMVYVEPAVAPKPAPTRAVLEELAAAPVLLSYLSNVEWMNPVYGKLRAALVDGWGSASALSWDQQRLVQLNLERARALPANPGRRYVLVDVATQRLFMYENGRVRDSMKVVVGKSTEQTPMMAGLIRFAMVNPYWNIPPDLVKIRVAPGVLGKGVSFLKTKGYEVTADWSDNAKVVDPKKVDWKAVAAGRQELPVRQIPGRDNAMGKMKFMFPNDLGIYLHDTPEKNLFAKADRRFSSGCVRVEDAPRLAKWLFSKPLTVKPGGREQRVNLPEPVPVYITYLTAAPEGEKIAFRKDVYNRDGAQLARLAGGSSGGR